ncbi:hypothetical protein C8046_12625 [Serinibacter arcticus]|uniref:Uncharacterized protein n=1 Tax=Serinibacter arcticus TaxID=1655435 RepID=A0A2U1ZWL8_9MICO|nr:SpaA isopeptide-forming pilin-related protein [Serinibacter arcticus]PWD51379.1 hypothetical protein C8046_12625 [Serinibacter arcticus]
MSTTGRHPASRRGLRRRRRERTARLRSAVVVVLALVVLISASPALALRFGAVTVGTPATTATQTYTQASTPNQTATWTTSPTSLSTGTTSWQWFGITDAVLGASGFPATVPTAQRVARSISVPAAGCSFTAPLVTECVNRGTVTVTFDRAVTNPILYVAGLGEAPLLSFYRMGAYLDVTTANVTMATPTAGATNLQVVGGTRLQTVNTRPSGSCNPLLGLDNQAGCGAVVLQGTFTSVTFSTGIRVQGEIGSGNVGAGVVDSLALYIALQDQPLPVANPDTFSAVAGTTGAPQSLLANDVAAAGFPLVPASTVFTATTGWTLTNNNRTATGAGIGTAEISATTGLVTFAPVAGYAGPSGPINYQITDSVGSTATSTVTFNVATGALACGTTVYQINASGEVRGVPTSAVGNAANATSTPLLPAVSGTTEANALGIAAGGTSVIYIATRGGSAVATRYDTVAGTYTHTTVTPPGVRVAGAVNPVNGFYYYGGVATGSAIYMFNPTTGVSFQVGTSPGSAGGNGDYAFTSAGDMFILSDAVITAVRATDLPTTQGTAAITGSVISSGQSQTSNGIAFGGDGFMYVNNTNTGSSNLQRVDPVTGALGGTLGTTTRATTSTFASIDLGACAPTASIRVEKDVAARALTTDQFTLQLATTGATALTGTTTGAATGVQSVAAGPMIGQVGRTYTFTETGAGTPAAQLGAYRPTWTCRNGATGTTLTTGTGATGTYAFTEASPTTVVCTFRNATGPLLSVDKTASATSFTVGQPASYAVAVTNTGQSATTAPITVTDVLATGITFTGASGAGWSCTGTGTLTCTYTGTLAPGATTTLTLGVTPTIAAVTGNNTATVSGGGDPTCSAAGRCSDQVAVSLTANSGRPVQCNALWGLAGGSPTATPAGNQVYTLDTTTGAATRFTTTPVSTTNNDLGNTSSLAIDPRTGRLFAADNLGTLAIRTLAPGSTTWTTTTAVVPGAAGVNGVARAVMDGGGFLYIGRNTADNGTIYRYPVGLDGSVGAPTTIPVTGIPTTGLGGGDFAIAPDGTFYLGAANAGTVSLYRIAPTAPATSMSAAAAATATLVPTSQTVSGSTDLGGLAFQSGTLYGAGSTASLFRFNLTSSGPTGTWPAAGGTTVIGPTGVAISDTAGCAGAATVQLAKTSVSGTGTFGFTGLTNVADNVGTAVTTDQITTTTAGTTVRSASTHVVTRLATAVTATETPTPGWSVVSGAGLCTDTNSAVTGNPATFGTITGAGALAVPAVNVRAGAAIVCTVTNTLDPVLATSKTLAQVNGSAAVPGQTVRSGDVLTYTITTGNTGGAGSVTLTEQVPAGTTYTGAGQGWSCAGGSTAGTGCSQNVSVPAGGSASRSFTVTVGGGTLPASISNTVSASSGTCASCTVTTAVTPLVPVTKVVVSPTLPAVAGGTVVTYRLTLANGAGVAGFVDHQDVLTGVLDDAVWPSPGGVPAQPQVAPAGSVTASYSAATQRLTLGGTVPAGQSVTVTYQVQVKPWDEVAAGAGDATLRNAVVRTGATPPPTCAPGSTTCTTTPIASYSLTKSSLPVPATSVDPGERIDYTVTVASAARSTGPVTGVQVTDNLTDVLADAAFVPGSVVLTVGAGAPQPLAVAPALDPVTQQWLLTSPAFTLPAGATATLRYAVEVADVAWFAQLRNVAGVTGGIPPAQCLYVPGAPPGGPTLPACENVHVVNGFVELAKVGLDGSGSTVPMAGSAFAIHTIVVQDDEPVLGPVLAGVTPEPVPGLTGRFAVAGIPVGSYLLVETRAPEGYSLLARPVPFEVTAQGTVLLDGAQAPAVTVANPPGVTFPVLTVRDVPRFAIPEAGGTGQNPFHAVGLGLLAGALAILGRLQLRRRAGTRPAVEGRS